MSSEYLKCDTCHKTMYPMCSNCDRVIESCGCEPQDTCYFTSCVPCTKERAIALAALEELRRARKKFPKPFNSPHEGWAVLREEVDELWDEVKADSDAKTMRSEAIQVAAMALRFMLECCDE